MFMHTWLFPIALMAVASIIAFPLRRYVAWVMDGKYRLLPGMGWLERRMDSGPQTWKRYTLSLLIFNVLLFVFGYLVLALQPWMPFNPDGKGMLAPSTIFNSVISFMTNTNLQHYSGEVHLSNFSQVFFCIANMFLSASVGFCALVAIIRMFRGESRIGNFFLDMWRVVVYMFVPAALVFGVMATLMAGCLAWSDAFDTLRPHPAFTAHAATCSYDLAAPGTPGGQHTLTLPVVAGLPVDQHQGNLEGKELRFGTSAGATYDALTTDVTCGAVNAEENSMTPMASLSPMVGMWLNCIFGGKGVGMINMLVYIIIGIFIAGMLVGRTPEDLGRKIGAKEVKLAVITLLVHPFLILVPTGLFAATAWGLKAVSNPGANGSTQMLSQFSSASANNGSAFDGLGVTYGFANSLTPAATAIPWDIATGLVMLLSRYLPIVAPLALAAYLGAKKVSPAGLGTLRDDTPTFGFLVLATILIVGALLFLPVAVLGPIAEHFGPIPFGG